MVKSVDEERAHVQPGAPPEHSSSDNTGSDNTGKAKEPVADRTIALLLAAIALGMYLRTLAPGLLAGDPGEFQVAAWNFGLAHPTGYPLYMLLGGAWQHLLAPFGLQPATALNIFSALCGAATVALFYLLMRNWLPGSRIVRQLAALFSAILFAVNPTFWNQSSIAEVYALHALFLVLILLAAQRLAIQNDDGRTESVDPSNHSSLHPFTPSSLHPLLILSLLIGLSLTHHATTLLIVPGLLLYLFLLDHRWWRSGRVLVGCAVALTLPLLLYLYIPLRSGPAASPWYHQDLGGETLHLYTNSWDSFVRFITGQSIAIGFRTLPDAWAQVGYAASQWRVHFTWVGLVLIGLGLVALVVDRRWLVLVLTVAYALVQQTFNLFYAIEDIFVYYIPLFLMGAIWAGFAAAQLAAGDWRRTTDDQRSTTNDQRPPATSHQPTAPLGLLLILLLFFLPVRLAMTYFPHIDRSHTVGARERWEAIVDAEPPVDAILVSNDRNEIVPLFYLQSVENRGRGWAGIFPQIAPEPRFSDIGATLQTALAVGAERPVYLIKPMPGLAVRFALAERTPPLVEVLGPVADAAAAPPSYVVNEALGPLTLLGYDVVDDTGHAPARDAVTRTVQIELLWQVDAALRADYTTTVQLYDGTAQRIAQSDRAPGGDYYPTSLWKPGEILRETHRLELPQNASVTDMLVGMYTGPATELLAPPLEIPWR